MKRMLLSAMLLFGAATPALANEGATAKLSPEIRQKVQDTRARYKEQFAPLMRDARSARQALRDEMKKAQPNATTLSQLEDRIVDDRQKLEALRDQVQKELRGELSPEQYAQLMIARQDRFGRRMHHRDRDAE